MWFFRRVVGNSMSPTLRNGQTVIVSQNRNFKKGDLVVAYMGNRQVIKRITDQKNGKVYLEGDNKNSSSDSRIHGWLIDRHVMGRVIWPVK